MALLVRIIAGSIVAVVVVLLVWFLAHDAGFGAALRQWLMSTWKIALSFSSNLLKRIGLEGLLAGSQQLFKRMAFRHLTKPFVRAFLLFIPAIITWLFGRYYYRLAHVHTYTAKKKTRKAVKTALKGRPGWPRGVYALIATASIAIFVWIFFQVHYYLGFWFGMAYSIVAAYMMEKISFLGLDHLAAWLYERLEPRRQYMIKNHPVLWTMIRCIWMGPLIDIARGRSEALVESLSKKHGDTSFLDRWRARRKAPRDAYVKKDT